MRTPVLNESNLRSIPEGRNSAAIRSVRAGDWQVSEKIYRPDAVLPAHHHERASATLILAGALRESSGDRTQVCGPMSWVQKPAGIEHANRFGSAGARVLEVVHLGRPESVRLAYEWTHGGADTLRWLRVYRELQLGDADAVASATELCSSLGAERPPESRAGSGSRWVRRVVDRLRDTEDEAPGVSEIARELSLHPVYVARAFRRATGCTIGQYRRVVRVERAARLLGRTRRSIAEIAAEVGFSDQAHLTRVFKAETGMTPGAYREMLAR